VHQDHEDQCDEERDLTEDAHHMEYRRINAIR
jgi:hypothetical protein